MILGEAELYFAELAQNREKTVQAWQYISDEIGSNLQQGNYTELFKLIPYIESGDGQLAFRYIGDSRRIMLLLHMMQLEYGHGITPFGEGCATVEELLEKYMLTVFALRRILFQLPELHREEGISFLRSSAPSAYAVYFILTGDLILPAKSFWQEVAELMQDIWTVQEKQFFDMAGER